MMEWRSGQAGRGAFRLIAAVVGAVLAPAAAKADAEDAALRRVFAAGLGDLEDEPPRLILRRAGTSLELRALGTDGDEIGLSCLLCNAVEQQRSAWELGARLAGRSSAGDGPWSPALREPARDAGRGARRGPLIMGGGGLAVAAAGIVLLVFDGRCASPRRDEAGNCATLHHLAPAGWALAGTGAAAVLAAVLWWLLDGAADGDRPGGVAP